MPSMMKTMAAAHVKHAHMTAWLKGVLDIGVIVAVAVTVGRLFESSVVWI